MARELEDKAVKEFAEAKEEAFKRAGSLLVALFRPRAMACARCSRQLAAPRAAALLSPRLSRSLQRKPFEPIVFSLTFEGLAL